ncbi:MAG: efflux RND transporter permease subunit, partial [Myxococcota bacterium]
MERHWKTLEYPKILAQLARYTDFSAGADLARALEPSDDYRLAREWLALTTEGRALLLARPDFGLGGVSDVRPLVEQARRGVIIEPGELLRVRDTLLGTQRLQRILERLDAQFPRLADLAFRFVLQPELAEAIGRVLNDRGEVKDDASPELARIRRELRLSQDRIQEKLQRMISSSSMGRYLQEAMITRRQGRFVIPVQANFKGQVDGVVDLNIAQQADIPFLTADFDRDAIAHYGLRVDDVAEVMEAAFRGHEVGRVMEEQRSFDLAVRYPEEAQKSVEAIRQTLITTPTGVRVPLHALAEVRRDRRPNTIARENAQRHIVVSANVAGADLVGVVDAVRDRVGEQVELPAGYHIEYGGQFESATEASRTLTALTLLVIVGIFMLLYMSLGSTRDTLLVMVNLPLALIGGVAGIYLLDGVLSVASLIGFITLFGIATRNGLLMVTHIRHLYEVEDERDVRRAVVRGAKERLAPILMTALASGLGLVPLALKAGEAGSEIQAPMAVVILCGLVTSTALNML